MSDMIGAALMVAVVGFFALCLMFGPPWDRR